MHSSASMSRGPSNAAQRSDAPSSTAPAAVSHDCPGNGERKYDRTGKLVWVSLSSVNHSSHERQTCVRSSKRSKRQVQASSCAPLGGTPARSDSLPTAASRREKDA